MNLGEFERYHFDVAHAGDRGVPARVRGDQSAADRGGECGAQGAVKVSCGGGTGRSPDVLEEVVDLTDRDSDQLGLSQRAAVRADEGLVGGEGSWFAAALDL